MSAWQTDVKGGRDQSYKLLDADLLVCDEDLECRDELSHGDGLVGLPLVESVDIIQEDDEVVVLALVVDLDLLSVSANHFDCRWYLGYQKM